MRSRPSTFPRWPAPRATRRRRDLDRRNVETSPLKADPAERSCSKYRGSEPSDRGHLAQIGRTVSSEPLVEDPPDKSKIAPGRTKVAPLRIQLSDHLPRRRRPVQSATRADKAGHDPAPSRGRRGATSVEGLLQARSHDDGGDGGRSVIPTFRRPRSAPRSDGVPDPVAGIPDDVMPRPA